METIKTKASPRDFFLHLGTIVALYVSAISLLNLLFTLADVAFPVAAYNNSYTIPSISWPTASLIIFFPLLVLLSWLLYRDYRMYPEKRNLGVRKWLIYITLFITGLAFAGDLVMLLYYFLNGDTLTTAFLLKVFTVLIVTGGVFIYYVLDLGEQTSAQLQVWSAVLTCVLIVGAIASGFTLVGSPATQRAMSIDRQRISNLQDIQSQVKYYWQSKRTLPKVLSDAFDPLSNMLPLTDPETGEPYGYQKTGDLTFDLCANFSREDMSPHGPFAYPQGAVGENWQHAAGHVCFARKINPQFYPPLDVPLKY